jgi:hypothetical protein
MTESPSSLPAQLPVLLHSDIAGEGKIANLFLQCIPSLLLMGGSVQDVIFSVGGMGGGAPAGHGFQFHFIPNNQAS